MSLLKDTKWFVEKSISIHGKTYDYKKSKYLNAKEKRTYNKHIYKHTL